MARLRLNRRGQAGAALLLVLAVSAGFIGGKRIAADGDAPAVVPFERSDAETIRAHTREILSDPQFAPRKTLLQWLSEKLSAWKGPTGKWDPWSRGWRSILFWIFLIWGTATILFILGHMGWTLAVFLRGRFRGGRFSLRQPRFRREHAASYHDLLLAMRRRAEQGAFRDALGIMMVALLHWLDEAAVLRFHPSKTNGDYVREYPASRPTRDAFRRFVRAFDQMIYGAAPCEREEYAGMTALYERILNNVRQKS